MAAKRSTARITRDDGAELLITAALDLARSDSPAKITVRDIAVRAGLQTMHVKRYFGSRNGLLVAVSNRLMQHIVGPLIDMPVDRVFPYLRSNPDVALRLRIVSHLIDEGVDPAEFVPDRDIYLSIADRIATVNNVGKRTARTYASVIQLVLQGSTLMGPVNALSARQQKDIVDLLAILGTALPASEKALGW